MVDQLTEEEKASLLVPSTSVESRDALFSKSWKILCNCIHPGKSEHELDKLRVGQKKLSTIYSCLLYARR